MKNKLLITLAYFTVCNFCQAQLQTISSLRLDELKLKMPVDSVNKVLNAQLQVKASKYEFSTDTMWVNYKGDSVRLVFNRYIDEKKQVVTSLQNIYAAAKTLKTKSGIKTGDNKFDIIKKLDGSTLRMAPDWFFENAPDKKLRSCVVLYDYDNYSIVIFHFYNNLLYAFECAYTPDAE